ncbi:hypothetical protein E2562_035486 [Oryza meyeriana var. granulata]|uniref:Uncharacterized protein n=1 Tax=Oryza meyeriana var. granulata TaxID=110450 RepID=A0A6G1CL93_9ORYZ|nr:hypothetical protein E2562_035486 [Oryza meyeriana var. granulata]
MSVQHEGIYDDMPCRWLFEALSPVAQSSHRGKKRKRIAVDAETVFGLGHLQSPSPGEGRGDALAELESGGGSCDSYKSDSSSAAVGKDDVVVAADALVVVCAKSPEAVRMFVRHVTPATVVRSIDWDLIRAGNRTEVLPLLLFSYFVAIFSPKLVF